jgi:hypothetical protein
MPFDGGGAGGSRQDDVDPRAFICPREEHGKNQRRQVVMTELDEVERRTIFAALVEAEDRGLSGAEARKLVGVEFAATPQQVRGVEMEGEREQWPPLGE